MRNLIHRKIIKKYWPRAALLVIGGVLVFFFKLNLKDQSYLVLDFDKNTHRKFQGKVVPDMTILEALNSSSAAGNFDFRYSMDENGVLQIARIDGAINLAGGPNWHFFLNGASVEDGKINNIRIKAGDLIEARYE